MKVIGIADRNTYICEVNHKELEKFLNLYYGNLETLKAGSEIDLGRGYDFNTSTKAALETTRKFIDDNKKVVEAILNGISVYEFESNQQSKG